MSDFTVEPMCKDDWPAICAIYAEGIAGGRSTFERSAPSWEDWDRGHLADCRFVARDGEGRVLGWVALSPYSTRPVYAGVADLSVYVATAAQGRGIGKALMLRLIEASEAAGIWTLQAGVIPENAASIALHESCGFRRVGVRERIGRDLNDRWTDVVLLERRSRVVGL